MIAPGGHGHMFCYELQFRQWVASLEQQTEDVVVDERRSGETDMKRFTVFEREQNPL